MDILLERQGVCNIFVHQFSEDFPWAKVELFEAKRRWKFTINKFLEHHRGIASVRDNLTLVVQQVPLARYDPLLQISKLSIRTNVIDYLAISLTVKISQNLCFIEIPQY